MSDALDKLEDVLKAATPGPWVTDPRILIGIGFDSEEERRLARGHWGPDAAYIATFSPALVGKLLAVVRAARDYREGRLIAVEIRNDAGRRFSIDSGRRLGAALTDLHAYLETEER